MFLFLDYLPGRFTIALSLVMIVIFFVTSADSGALVLNMMASGGVDETPVFQRVLWTGIIAAISATLSDYRRLRRTANRDDCKRASLFVDFWGALGGFSDRFSPICNRVLEKPQRALIQMPMLTGSLDWERCYGTLG